MRSTIRWAAIWAVLLTFAPLQAQDQAKQGDKPKTSTKPLTKEEVAARRAAVQKAREEAARFLRIRRDKKGKAVAMETSIVRYISPKHPGVVVDLVGAVHIGDKSYYDELNKQFVQYDALLYELVAPEGAKPQPGAGNAGNPVSGLQVGMKNMLELQFQLDCVDYTKENFVHADMSPEEFAASMKKRGESMTQLFFRMLGQGLAQQDPSGSQDAKLFLAFFSKNRAQRMKQVMAEQFQEMEATMSVLNGPDGTTIITERNKKALAVLDREIKKGRKSLGIFYGAGHLPDMEERLAKDGFKPSGRRWLTAWALSPK